MRMMVIWDDLGEAELIDTFLNVDTNVARIVTEVEDFHKALYEMEYDCILMALSFPNESDSFGLFQKIREAQPEAPVVGAVRLEEVTLVAKFILNGLHSYVTRDDAGSFIFLLTSTMEAAFMAIQAQRSQIIADKLREEVESVRQLQESVLPQDLPMPEGYQIAARYEPSQIRVFGNRPVVMAGGDYYDVFNFGGDMFVLVLGDAAGHGVKACMSIMTMHTLISMMRDRDFPTTAEFVTEVNQRLCQSDIVGADQGGFITLLHCTLDASKHLLQWTSAGHPMPLLQNLETNEIKRLGSRDKGGLPLIIDDEWEYEGCEAVIPENSRILLYTDGLEEAFPEDGDEEDQFGEEGIIATLKDCIDLPIEETMQRLFDDSHAATGGHGRHDDTTILVLERRPL